MFTVKTVVLNVSKYFFKECHSCVNHLKDHKRIAKKTVNMSSS